MAESRVEKFKDYRKSILRDGEFEQKSKINTSLEEGSIDSRNGPSFQEEVLLKQIIRNRRTANIFYFGFILVIAGLMLAFGLILF